jgi:molybdate transport system regulatory protein
MRRNATEGVGALQSAHESILAAQPKTKIWLEHGGRFMIGDGGLHLLEGIARSGSLAEAVREIGWSYRHAWGYLRRAESVLGAPLLLTRPGKGAARGTTLTPAGRLLLERLRALRDRIDEALGPTGPTRDEIASRGRLHPRRRAKTTRRR